MEQKTKTIYDNPKLEVIELRAERGFAGTGGTGGSREEGESGGGFIGEWDEDL